MDELEGRIRSWVDSVASADGRRMTADDAIERAERNGPRSGARPRRLAAALVAAAVVVVIGGVVVRGSGSGGDGSLHVAAGPSASAPGSSTSNGDPRLLGVVEGDGTEVTPFIATSEAGLVEMWASSGLAGDPPVVDFDRHVVMALMTPRNACEMESFAVDGQLGIALSDGVGDPADRRCPEHLDDLIAPVVRPATFLVVVERG